MPVMQRDVDHSSQAAIIIDPPSEFAFENSAYHDGDYGKPDLDDANRTPISVDVERDSYDDTMKSGSCCCSGVDCCNNRRCNSYLHDKAIACRSFAKSTREFVTEVGEMIGSVDVRRRARRVFTKQTALNTFPMFKWLPKYRLIHLQSDLIAGLAVSLTSIPQSIAYAKVAGLTPQYGLYTAFMASFFYTLLGTSKDVYMGPVAIISLLVASQAQSPIPGDPTYAIIVSLIGGGIQLLLGVFRLGFLLDYISHPVVISFTTTSALTVAEGQLKKLLGLTVKLPRDFFNELIGTLKNIPNASLSDSLMGVTDIILLIILKAVRDIKFKNPNNSRVKRVVQYCFWLIGIGRNAIVVLLSAVASAIFAAYNLYPFRATNETPSGLPKFQVPKFSLGPPLINETYTTSDIFSSIGTGFVIIPLLCVLEAIAIGKAFGKKNGYRVDSNQELIAIGVGNIMGSFVSAYPATASFSRSSINSQSGVKTPAAGAVVGTIVIIALLFLTPYLNYIPDSTLAAVIICAVIDLIDFSLLPKLWRINKAEIFPWLLTFFCGLGFGPEYGILFGIGWTLLTLLWPWNQPKVRVVSDELLIDDNVSGSTKQLVASRVIVISISHGNLFPSIERLRGRIAKKGGEGDLIVLDFSKVAFFDYTIIEGMGHLISDFADVGKTCIIANIQPDILEAFEKAKLKHFRHAQSTDEAILQLRATQSAQLKEGDSTGDNDSIDRVTSSMTDSLCELGGEVDDYKTDDEKTDF